MHVYAAHLSFSTSVAVNKIPNFLADPNTGDNTVMPHHRCTIHINCEQSSLIHDAYLAAQSGHYAQRFVCLFDFLLNIHGKQLRSCQYSQLS